ncbi:uncharacterized protein JN550_011179 [Neoarthrinium moseri]|uniref:uncharacterized protein n=1 Tax=Neoarthrinium moseri TaxID=1658444 RepID=UPI001FDD4C19|nr:uncharacterized protein JN550_011179 [Neoarthrinium moseri]KAI1860864.1 hypothetical protein JN550_011179 [Neoarthrinium moseri]
MAEGDPSILLEGFIRHVDVLSQDSSYQYLKGVLEENSTLKERNNILNITNDENHRAISRLQTQLDDSNQRWEEQAEELATLAQAKALIDEKAATLESDIETAKAQLDKSADEASRLQKELSDKATELETANAELGSAKAETDLMMAQLDEARVDCSNLKADISYRDSQIERLTMSLEEEKVAHEASKSIKEEVTKELQSIREDLEAKNTRLGELNALSYRMKNPPQEQTQQQLHSMFTTAYKWAENLFSADFDESMFAAPSSGTLWAKLRNHGRVNRIIPMPLSNTFEAKCMRISAILAIVAWSFSMHIFQPTFLLQCNELSDLLAGLADDDPVRENYLRSVMLPVLPSKQKANGKKRIEQVVLDVFACIGPVLPNNRRDEVRSSLETMCKQVCGQWMRLQLLDEKIEPNFEAYDEEDWKLLRLPTLEDSQNRDAEAKVAADDTATESAIADEEDHFPSVGDIEDIAAVVWPSFLSFRGGESELLTEGFVLTKDQVKPAYAEEKAALLQGIHRAARQVTRRDRTKSFATTNGDDLSSSGGARALVKDFLPAADSEDPPGPNNEIQGESGGAPTMMEPEPEPLE